MAGERPSEQDERLELDQEPEAAQDPATWRSADPDHEPLEEAPLPGEQFSKPDGGNEIEDYERTEIARDDGAQYPAGPEQDATHIEDREDDSGRTWR